MASKTIAITGGSGFVGRHIARRLADEGHAVVIFSRSPKTAEGGICYASWNPDEQQMDANALQEVEAVIHLAGASVADKRWTPARKQEIINSRVAATHFLHGQLAAHAPWCKTFVASSATGYYGPDRDGLTPFHEDAPPYTDFLAQVCRDWEEATFSGQSNYGTTVVLRTGIVLGKDGGAYPELSGPMKFGILPILGNGKQIVSWIHVDDLAAMYIEAALGGKYKGVYNAVTPHPVTHLALMKAIAKAKGGIKIPAPVPPFVLQLIMGDASVEVLKSCTVSSAKVEGEGFSFRYATADEAITAIVSEG